MVMLSRKAMMTGGATETSFVILPEHLHDNNYSTVIGDYYRSSTFARAVFTTSATEVTIDTRNNIYSTNSGFAEVGVRVNGIEYSTVNLIADGQSSSIVALPGGSKTVEIIAGPQNKPSSTLLGTFIYSVVFNRPAIQVMPSVQASQVVVYGDSISGGFAAGDAVHESWTVLLRNDFNTAVDAWGYRALNDEVDAAARQSLADQLAGYNPTIVWLAIGVNDYTVNPQTATDFGTEYGDLMDKIHAVLPSAAIYAQSPIIATSEGANALGDHLQEYRDAIETACTTRAWATYVDGYAFLLTSDLADGVHPSTAGHDKYYTSVKNELESSGGGGDSTGWRDGAIAAYYPRGASSLLDSYINLANPGIFNASPGVAPWQMPSYGWRFTGNQWLDTSVFAAPGYTIMAKFANARFTTSTSFHAICAALDPTTPASMYMLQRQTDGVWYGYGDKAIIKAPNMTEGVLTLAANKGYRNGVLDATVASPVFVGTSTRSLYIGARNDGSPALFGKMDLYALAIWDTTLSDAEIASKATQWAAL